VLYRELWCPYFYPRIYGLGPCKPHIRKIKKRIMNSNIYAYFFLYFLKSDLLWYIPFMSLSLKNIGDGIWWALRLLSTFAISIRNFFNNFNLAIYPLYSNSKKIIKTIMWVRTLMGIHNHSHILLSKKINIKLIPTFVAPGLVMAPVIIFNPIYNPHIKYSIGK
jgi:hypothetical protein